MAKDEETGEAKGQAEKKPAAAKKGGDKGTKKGKPVDTGPAPKYKREQPPRLKTTYEKTVKAQMMKEFNYSSIM